MLGVQHLYIFTFCISFLREILEDVLQQNKHVNQERGGHGAQEVGHLAQQRGQEKPQGNSLYHSPREQLFRSEHQVRRPGREASREGRAARLPGVRAFETTVDRSLTEMWKHLGES